jgi:hypothetical protein
MVKYGVLFEVRTEFLKCYLDEFGFKELTVAREVTPQNFSSRKVDTQQYVATKSANPICKFLSYIN